MFVHIDNFNEGAFNKKSVECKKVAQSEGNNPKSNVETENNAGWHSAKKLSHVNLNWEKLRR